MKELALACTLLVGCAPAAPALPDLEAARMLGREVSPGASMVRVEALAADHAADPKLPCDGFPEEALYPSCELSHDSAIRTVRETLESLGYATRVEAQGEEPLVAYNVVGEHPGTDRASEVVLVAAHVDAFYSGADDNSSGVAVLLEVARVASAHRFHRTLRFVGFDLEERGARGSTRYVNAGFADDVVAALVLECVGYADHRQGTQDAPPGLRLGDVGDSLVIAANGDSVELAQQMLAIDDELDIVPLRVVVAGGSGAHFFTGPLLRSDNGPFWLRGRPALMLTDTANYRNPHYHAAGDLPETLDSDFLDAVATLVATTIGVLAEVTP
jgi:hypothetical protein